jgi:UPF0716 protein FxsA
MLYPFLELLSLFYLGKQVGLMQMALYLIGTFVIGVNLIRSAGFNSLKTYSPTTVLEAPFRLMAGVLLLVPGVFSDALAVLILVPFVRKLVWTYLLMRLFRGRVFQTQWSYQGQRPFPGEGDVFDVTAVRQERDVTPGGPKTLPSSLNN